MKVAFFAIVILGLAAYANAECANACSGHGLCGTKDECTCFPNWQAADCSERVCPYGLAWVDTPRGDLNHDGVRSFGNDGLVSVMSTNKAEYESYPVTTADAGVSYTAKAAMNGEAHFYTECSNKGLCDREFGTCQCFDGYTGSSCQRTTCPNDCTGHGVCRTTEEVAQWSMTKKKIDSVATENFYEGAITSTMYRLWDMDKAQTCVCDPGYSGPDCSRRECPRGDDPLTHLAADCGGAACANEQQVFTFDTTGTAANTADWVYITFEDWTGFEWRTDVFEFGSDVCIANGEEPLARIVKEQLQAIPNSIFEEIDVAVDLSVANTITVTVDFVENAGNINMLTWVNNVRLQELKGSTCAADESVTVALMTYTTTNTDGNTEESTCSNRGLCDYETGVCKCFKGYFNDDCSAQNALAQ